MVNRMVNSNQLRRRAPGAGIALAALLVAAAAPVRVIQAQETQTDPRWQAWVGCWRPVERPTALGGLEAFGVVEAPRERGDAPVVCVVPAAGTTGVDITTVVNGSVVERERVVATGEQTPSAQEGCTGWERAEFSPDGRRVYRRAEGTCAGGQRRRSSGLLAISPEGQWLDVQGVTVGTETGVRVLRYREAISNLTLPAEVQSAVSGGRAARGARIAAAAPVSVAEVADAARRLDAAVVEGWLVERGAGFDVDAKRLVELADAGVPERVIDLVVALSYPKQFAINPASRDADFRADGDPRRTRSGSDASLLGFPVGTVTASSFSPTRSVWQIAFGLKYEF